MRECNVNKILQMAQHVLETPYVVDWQRDRHNIGYFCASETCSDGHINKLLPNLEIAIGGPRL